MSGFFVSVKNAISAALVTVASNLSSATTEIYAAFAASGGSGLIGFIQTGISSVTRTVSGRLADTIHLSDKGTTANMLTALNAVASDFAATGGNCEIEAQTWVLPSGFTFVGDRLTLSGKGRQVTRISFDPATPQAALTINNPASGGSNQGAIRNMGFTSANAIAKTAIKLMNAANWDIEGIATSSGEWSGDSIGIQTNGRQFVRIKKCELACARPIVLSPNATWPSLATDHFFVSDSELIGTSATRPVIELETGASFANTTFERLAIVGGQHGIYWNDTTSTAASFNLKISDIRSEQGIDPAGWAVYLSPTIQQLQSVEISNVYLGGERNGIFINGAASRVVMKNVSYVGGAGKTALQMVFSAGSRLTMINCWNQSGSAVTLTNARCVRRESVVGIGAIEEWVYDLGPEAGALSSDTPIHGRAVSVANGASTVIASVNLCGFVFVTVSEDVSAIFCLLGPTAVVQKVADTAGLFSATKNTAAMYNVYYEGGSYFVQNMRGSTQTVSVFKIGTTA